MHWVHVVSLYRCTEGNRESYRDIKTKKEAKTKKEVKKARVFARKVLAHKAEHLHTPSML